MRTRNQTTPFVIPAGTYKLLRYNATTGALVQTLNQSNPTTPVVVLDGLRSITDELPFRKFEGNCNHDVTNHEGNFFSFTKEWTTGGFRNVETWTGGYWYYLRLRTLTPTWSNPGITVSNRDWRDLSYAAVQAMRPRFDTEGVSLANDIAEFRQLRDVLRPARREAERIRRGENVNSVRGRTKFASELFLMNEFGLQPLIRNVESILELLRTIPQRLAALRRTANKPKIGHYSRELDILTTLPAPDQTPVYTDGGSPPFKVDREVRFIKLPKYHATMSYTIDINRFNDVALWVRAWCEALGLTKPVSILWNAIPFSFVVDWFANVSEFLDSVFSEPVIPIVIRSFSHSVVWKYRTRLWVHEPWYVGRILGHDRTTSHYERRRDIPAFHSRFEIGNPFPGKPAAIAAALLGAYLPSGAANSKHKRKGAPKKINWRTGSRSQAENQAIDRR